MWQSLFGCSASLQLGRETATELRIWKFPAPHYTRSAAFGRNLDAEAMPINNKTHATSAAACTSRTHGADSLSESVCSSLRTPSLRGYPPRARAGRNRACGMRIHRDPQRVTHAHCIGTRKATINAQHSVVPSLGHRRHQTLCSNRFLASPLHCSLARRP